MKRKKSNENLTAAEFLSRLETDASYQTVRQAQENESNKRALFLQDAEHEIVQELRQLGYDVQTVWDLVNTSEPYTSALPVLVKHVSNPYPDAIRDGIARALAVKTAKFAWGALISEYVKAQESREPRFKQGLAVALSVIYDHSHFEEIRQLLSENSHGESRILLLEGIKSSRNPMEVKLIDELANDPTFEKEIASWKRNRKHAD